MVVNMVDLTTQIKEKVQAWGGDLCGFADLEVVRAGIRAYYDRYDDYSRAVSIGVFLPAEVIDELTEGPTDTYAYCYQSCNRLLDDIVMRLCSYLGRAGCKAYPIFSSQIIGEAQDRGAFSHRLAAKEAGLGWIGKSCCLVTPQVGPALRLATVLTDAPLATGKPIKNRCGDCTQCADHCPARAIKGVAFEEGQDRAVRLDFDRCHQLLLSNQQTRGQMVCGVCVSVCPWRRRSHHQ